MGRHADDVNVVLDCLASGLLGGLEQRADIDVEADIGEGGGDDLGAAVVTVLTQFGDQHARPPPFFAGKTLDLALDAAEAFVALVLRAINPARRADLSAVTGEDLFRARRRSRPPSPELGSPIATANCFRHYVQDLDSRGDDIILRHGGSVATISAAIAQTTNDCCAVVISGGSRPAAKPSSSRNRAARRASVADRSALAASRSFLRSR